jgi:Lon protease-like protein
MVLPATIPLIVLPECTVFPHALLPLYIFEQRYRAMLSHALDTHRHVCVGCLNTDLIEDLDDVELDSPEADQFIFPVSCAGLIRACVGQPDGTSRLILQGLTRVRFIDWEQRSPFRIARVEAIPSRIEDPIKANALSRFVLQGARAAFAKDPVMASQFDRQFGELTDPEVVADVIAHSLLPNASTKLPLLEYEVVEDRLEYLLAHLMVGRD